ncbi:hypothetical protein CDAR_296951 [Caerostris darwini]|uniref:Uncharacterized protein n=1 Tax=Caerostris darwini TaxID=1538125 RepID=A0AAV4UPE3_9ARAC|nr:hypothetical protein CDAR_296951 [Caerostris darwini]
MRSGLAWTLQTSQAVLPRNSKVVCVPSPGGGRCTAQLRDTMVIAHPCLCGSACASYTIRHLAWFELPLTVYFWMPNVGCLCLMSGPPSDFIRGSNGWRCPTQPRLDASSGGILFRTNCQIQIIFTL